MSRARHWYARLGNSTGVGARVRPNLHAPSGIVITVSVVLDNQPDRVVWLEMTPDQFDGMVESVTRLRQSRRDRARAELGR